MTGQLLPQQIPLGLFLPGQFPFGQFPPMINDNYPSDNYPHQKNLELSWAEIFCQIVLESCPGTACPPLDMTG